MRGNAHSLDVVAKRGDDDDEEAEDVGEGKDEHDGLPTIHPLQRLVEDDVKRQVQRAGRLEQRQNRAAHGGVINRVDQGGTAATGPGKGGGTHQPVEHHEHDQVHKLDGEH